MSPNQHDPKPQRRDSDVPHRLSWWLKWAAGACVSLTIIGGFLFASLTFAREQIAAPIEAKLEKLAARDSTEQASRISGDANVSEKLDLVIRLLTKRNR